MHQIEEFTTIFNSEKTSSTEASVKERLKSSAMIDKLFKASVSRYVYFVGNNKYKFCPSSFAPKF